MTPLQQKIADNVWDYPPHGVVEKSMRSLLVKAEINRHGKVCSECKANLVSGNHLRGCAKDDASLVEQCAASLKRKMGTL